MKKNLSAWTLLSNHTHVLVCLTQDSNMRVRDMASHIGITERAVQRIIVELEDAGLLSHERTGRRNSYQIHLDQPLRHPLEKGCSIGSLLQVITGQSKG